MAVGKSKKQWKTGKKRVVDPFLRKEWYDIKAPSMFNVRDVGKTLVSKTQGTKIASDGLKGRIYEVSLADLNKDEDLAYRKIKLRCDDVQGKDCLTSFHGMDFARDKLCALIRKWQSLIEAHVEVKTTDGYMLRMFCIGFTKRRQNQICKTTYAQTAQIKKIRKKMTDIMTREASTSELKDLVKKFIPEVIGNEIQKACGSIYPLQNVFIRKVKVLKTPKFDHTKFMELHGTAGKEDTGSKVEKPVAPVATEAAAAPATES